MKRLIIIDHSIKGVGGHHLDYALRVLLVAKKQGWRTVLVTNREFADEVFQEVDEVYPSFSKTFWENYSAQMQHTNLTNYSLLQDSWWKSHRALIKGLTKVFELVSSVVDMRLNTEIPPAKVDSKTIQNAKFQNKNFLEYLESWIVRTIENQDLVNRKQKVNAYVSRGVIQIPFVLLQLLILPVLILRRLCSVRVYDFYVETFIKELFDFTTNIKLSASDVVFLPTINLLEHDAVIKFLRCNDCSLGAWHLVHRFNIFGGRDPSYSTQKKNMKYEVEVLDKAASKDLLTNVSCYCDTRALVDQYNFLGSDQFELLPIPSNVEGTATLRSSVDRFVLGYFGDARDEKGFGLIGDLVLKSQYGLLKKHAVKFYIQSNFNIPKGEMRSRISMRSLAACSKETLELAKGPFSPADYAERITRSSVILIPYDDEVYYARSSGVFSEAMALGIPVVYPFRSWMGQVLRERNFRYFQEIWTDLLSDGFLPQVMEKATGKQDFHSCNT